MRHSLLILTTFLCWACTFGAPPLYADDRPRSRAQELQYDPQTGQWLEVHPPPAGTPQGDLAAAHKLLADNHISKASKAFRKWLKNYGDDHPLASEANLGLAEAKIAKRDYYKAHMILEPLVADVGGDEITQRALNLEFTVAEAFLAGQKRKWLGIRMLSGEETALKILDGIAANDAQSDRAERALKTKADYFFRRGEFDLAEDEYGRLIEQFPRSRWLLPASLRRAQATLAQFPGTKFDDAALIEAEERFLRFRDAFPKGAVQHDVDLTLEDIRNRRGRKELEIGDYYMKVRRPGAAAFYYRSVVENWPGTTAASEAQAALAAMGQLSAVPSTSRAAAEQHRAPHGAGSAGQGQ